MNEKETSGKVIWELCTEEGKRKEKLFFEKLWPQAKLCTDLQTKFTYPEGIQGNLKKKICFKLVLDW